MTYPKTAASHIIWNFKVIIIFKIEKKLVYKMIFTYYLIYFSMNFLWNSDRNESLIKTFGFFSGSERAQFLNTTSSSQRRLTLWSDLLLPDE